MVIIRTFPLNPFGLFFFLLILWENALLLLSLLDEKAIHDILKVSRQLVKTIRFSLFFWFQLSHKIAYNTNMHNPIDSIIYANT